jgi:hypothetical protein
VSWDTYAASDTVRLSQEYLEVVTTGEPSDQKVRLDQTYLEIITSGDPSGQTVRLDQQYLEVVMSLDQALLPSVATDVDSFFVPDVQGTSGSQTLTPALHVDTDAAYAPSVAPGAIVLQPGIVVSDDAIHAPNVGNYQQLVPPLLVDADTLHAPMLTSSATLSPGAVDADDVVYAPTTGQYWQLSPSAYADVDSLPSPTVTATTTLLPGAHVDADAIHAPLVVSVNYILSPLLDDADQVYATNVKRGPLTLEPDTLLFGTAFFSPSVFIQLHVAPPLLFDGDRFPFPTSSALYETSPGEFDADDAVFLPVITTGPITIFPPLYAEADVEYVPSVQRQSKGGGNGGGGSGGTVTTNLKYASQFVMSDSGLITALEVQASSAKVINTRMMIYADAGGVPGALLGQTNVLSSVVLGANDYTLATPVSLLAGQVFWVALHSDGNFNWFLTNQKGGSRYNTDLFSDGPSDPFGAASVDNKKAPVFVVYLDAVNATVLPNIVQSDDAVYSPHVAGGKVLIPPFVADQNFTYGVAVHYSVTLVDTDRESSGDQFFTAAVNVGAVTVLPDLMLDDDVMRGADVGRGQGDVFPPLLSAVDTFPSPYVEVKGAALSAGAFNDADVVYAPIMLDVVTVSDALLIADDTTYAPTIGRGDVVIAPPLLADAREEVYDPLIVRIGGTYAVLPSLLQDDDVVHVARIGFPPIVHRNALRGDRSTTNLSGERGAQSLRGSRDQIDLEGER